MSYDTYLEYHNEDGTKTMAQVSRHEEGGTYAIGGIEEAHLNITYNYAWFFYHFLDKRKGLRWLYGKKAKDCISRLEKAVNILGADHPYKDYWAPTPGNAGKALSILLEWAKEHPEAIFDGD